MYTELESAAAAGRGEPGSREQNPRRLLLLNTTLRLVAEQGVDAVNHRSVAAAAEVPLGSTTYWFTSRQDMLVQALEHFVRLEMGALREHLAGVLGKRLSRKRLTDEFTAILLPQVGESRWRTVAQYALYQEAFRRPELAAVCREWNAAWREALTEVFASIGARDPELEAGMFLEMLDGLLLNQLVAADDAASEDVIRTTLAAWFERVPTAKKPNERKAR
jgi:DNA-binding transcriptional regulator YbjK